MAIKCAGIDHIHFNVPSLNKFKEIMGQLFDLDATKIGHMDAFGFYNSTMKIVGTDAGQPYLDVFQSARDDGEVANFVKAKGPCVSYISFRVENLDAAAEHAKKCGLKEISRAGYRGMKQVQFDTFDTLGFMLEFVEYEPSFWQELEGIKTRLNEGQTVDGLRYVEL